MFNSRHVYCLLTPKHKPLHSRLSTLTSPHNNILYHLSSDSPLPLSTVEQSHGAAVVRGLLPSSISITSALILSYAAHFPSSTTKTLISIFSQSKPFSKKTPFLHNTLIRACTIISNDDRAASEIGVWVYNGLLKEGSFGPDDYTFPFVLKLCADYGLVQKGLEVHGRLIKAGFDKDVFVCNTLLLYYGSVGDLWDFHRVFEEMPDKDLVSWNTRLRILFDNERWTEVFEAFKGMIDSGFQANVVSIVSLLPLCGELEDGIFMVLLIHCYALKAGLDREVKVGNALVDAYGKCGVSENLKGVFTEIGQKNEVSWNSIIGAFSHLGLNQDALDCLRAMVIEGMRLSTVTMATMLPVLVELNLFALGSELHGFAVKMRVDSDVFVANALIDMYGKCGHFEKALFVFYSTTTRNIVSWNTMIGNFAQHGLGFEAVQLIREMQAHGENPNSVTVTNVLPACARSGYIRHGMEIHARSIKTWSAFDLFVSNALADMYAKCGRLDLSRAVLNLSSRDTVSYNILINGYSQTRECANSVRLFAEMEMMGLQHDNISYMGALSACANLSAIKEGKQIHARAIRKLFHQHLFVANSLLDMYTKCGQIDVAKTIFDRIRKRDTASWNTMILGYGMLGEFSTATDLFEAMKEDDVRYDSVSYVAVLSACSHGGLVERGKSYFNDLLAQNIESTEMHYACMVDLLGRSGLIEEAVEMIEGLTIKPGVNIWGALLGATRLQGNMELGIWAAKNLLELKPDNPGYYVLLSNMYAEAGKWDEADRVRKLMDVRRVKKNPGFSWIEVEDQVHGFVAGERFDPYLWDAAAAICN